MLHVPTPTQNATARRRRRPWGSYRLSIDQRAVAAAITIKDHGWGTKAAAGLFGVCRTYVDLARRLSDADRQRLARGELKLADLHKDHLRQLAERRAQRLAAERAAKVQAERAAQVRAVDDVLERVELDCLVDRIVTQFGPGPLMAALDTLTAPQRVAAEWIITAPLASGGAFFR